MRTLTPFARRRFAVPAGLLLLTASAALAPSSAAAAGAPFTCEASVLRGSILVAPPIEPVVTNRGKPCVTTSAGGAGLTAPLGPVLKANVLGASTSREGPADRTDLQQVVAIGGVADVSVGSLASLGLALPLDAIALPPSVAIPPIDISVIASALNAADLLGQIPNVPNTLTIDVQAAVKELVKLPATNLLGLQSAVAFAAAGCDAGRPVTAGDRAIAGLSVLGNGVDLSTIDTQPIVDTQTINPAAIDLTKVRVPVLDALLPLSGNLLVAPVIAQLQTIVTNAVRNLPPIAIPIELARVQVKPGTQTKTADALTQTALEIKISALGQNVVDLVLGETKVGTAGVDCTPPADAPAPPAADQPPAAAAALGCTKRRLVLTDVVRKGSRVVINGVADKRFAGRTVAVVFQADKRTAGRALVNADGTFRTTAKLPSKRLRASNLARYQAVLGREKSLNLKLERRMTVTRLTAEDGIVRIAGRVTRPFADPSRTITLTRRVSCSKSEVVKRFKPRRDGTFSVTAPAPEGQSSAVYRLGTQVQKTAENPKVFPTFTLPQGVALEQ